jgi:pilus assembly protein Flp/PilA
MLRRFLEDERGSNALEYGLIVGVISLAIVTGATAAGSQLGSIFNTVSNQVSSIVTQIAGS